MCYYPTIRRNPRYKANKKNGGIIPTVNDPRTLYIATGCGECQECLKQKANTWTVRLLEDIKEHTNGKFVTFTFSEESLIELDKLVKDKYKGYDRDNQIATIAIRRFTERWRFHYKKTIRHWLITELGQTNTERIHLHGIIWTNETKKTVKNLWQYGNMGWEKTWEEEQNYVNHETIGYLVKYVTKRDLQHPNYKAIILTSNGIGKRYISSREAESNKFKEIGTNITYKAPMGYKMALPTYYKNKLYNDDQKEKLWIELLDKQERWVNKERVDISKGMEQYYALLKYNQKRNQEMKYGTGQKDWDQIEYEKQIRELKRKERWDKQTEKNGYPLEWDM